MNRWDCTIDGFFAILFFSRDGEIWIAEHLYGFDFTWKIYYSDHPELIRYPI